jgi:hypothetical protein
VNVLALVATLVPAGVETVTTVPPGVPDGATATIFVSETVVKDTAGWPAKLTFVASEKPVPVNVTLVPPTSVPELGAIAVTWGVGTTLLQLSSLPVASYSAFSGVPQLG